VARTSIKLRSAPLAFSEPKCRVYRVLQVPTSVTGDAVWRKRRVQYANALRVEIRSGSDLNTALIDYTLGPRVTASQTSGGSPSTATENVYATDWQNEYRCPIQQEDIVRIEVDPTGLPDVGPWVRRGAYACVFEGIVTNIGPAMDGNSEALRIAAVGFNWFTRGTVITGRFTHNTEDVSSTIRTHLPCIFNELEPDGSFVGNFDRTQYDLYESDPANYDDSSMFVTRFLMSDDILSYYREPWTVQGMLEYIVEHYFPATLFSIPKLISEIRRYADDFSVQPRDLNLEGMNALQAFEYVLGRVGYSFTEVTPPYGSPHEPHRIHLWKRGGREIGTNWAGRPIFANQKEVRLQAPPRTSSSAYPQLDPRKSDVSRFAQSIDSSEYAKSIIGVGAPIIVEDRFELSPDWDASKQDSDASKFQKPTINSDGESSNPYWEQNKNVYRRYILDEADENFTDKLGANTGLLFTSRPRRFLNRLVQGTDNGKIEVYIKTGSSEYVRWEKDVQPLTKEGVCGIYFEVAGVENVTKDSGQSTHRDVEVRAAIEADEALKVDLGPTIEGAQGEHVPEIIVYDDRFGKYIKIEDDGSVTTLRDDTYAFINYLQEKINRRSLYTNSTIIVIPRFTLKFEPGDVITRVRGRNVRLGHGHRYFPVVAGIVYSMKDEWTTELLLDDERLKA